MREYAFDVRMWAIVRIEAETKEAAEEQLESLLKGSSASLTDDDGQTVELDLNLDDYDLIEIDGEDVS